MKCLAGIDIGSSAIKAVLLRVDAMDIVEIVSQPLHSRVASVETGHFEENPLWIRDEVFKIVLSLNSSAREKGFEIERIAFTGQMHGGLLVDANLEPVTNFITWQDKRGDEVEDRGFSYVETLRTNAKQDPTGVGIHTGFLISTLYWLGRHDKIPSNASYVLGIYDWLTSLFVGRPVTDITSAAAWGMSDPIALRWRESLMEAAGISQSLLPEVAEPGAELGIINPSLAGELGLHSGVRIHASIGDTQAAYLGSECKPGELLLNFGTGSQSLWETSRLEATPGTDIRYLRNGRYLACAPTLAGGEAYLIIANFFRDILKIFADKEISMQEILAKMDRLALESDANGMTIDPIFRGSKFRKDSERGAITGATFENLHAGSIVRALIEGMIEEVAQPYFIREGDRLPSGLVGAGFALRKNPALQKHAEARFRRPIQLGRLEEAAASGAALLCFG